MKKLYKITLNNQEMKKIKCDYSVLMTYSCSFTNIINGNNNSVTATHK